MSEYTRFKESDVAITGRSGRNRRISTGSNGWVCTYETSEFLQRDGLRHKYRLTYVAPRLILRRPVYGDNQNPGCSDVPLVKVERRNLANRIQAKGNCLSSSSSSTKMPLEAFVVRPEKLKEIPLMRSKTIDTE